MNALTKNDPHGRTPNWCPGCGNFGIYAAVNQALAQCEAKPHQTVIVGGIGCGANLPYWSSTYGINSLHGRPIPVATGIAMANPSLTVLVVAGDGDTYGIGIGHLIHAIRRDTKLTCIVFNNGVYGLTKGQASPTAERGFLGPSTPFGNENPPLNPIALAITMNAGFVARGFAGDIPYLRDIIIQALQHPGFALIDVVQPCVTFNKSSSHAACQSRIRMINESAHDSSNQLAALALALTNDGSIPIGKLYNPIKHPETKPRTLQNLTSVKESTDLKNSWKKISPI